MLKNTFKKFLNLNKGLANNNMDEIFLRFEIQHDKPVDINTLSNSLNSMGYQYDSFLNRTSKNIYSKNDRRLLVKEVKSGSIIIDLIGATVPLLTEINTIYEFSGYLKNTFDFFLGKTDIKTHEYTKKDCQDFRNIVDITARDTGNATANINVYGNNNIIYAPVVNLSNTDANAIQSRTKRYEDEEIEAEEKRIFQKQLMYWADASFNSKYEKSAGKVIIETIDKKPKKVVFINEKDRVKSTTRHEKYPDAEWQDILRYVDVEVVKIQDVIKEYKVLQVYEDADIFDF